MSNTSVEMTDVDPDIAKQIAQSQDAQTQAEEEDATHARLQAQFSSDPRIHFSKETGAWHFEADDGREMQWDATKNVWVEVVDEDMLKAQQAAYAVEGVDEETPAAPVLARTNKKRKKEPVDYTSNTDPSAPGPTIKRGKNNKGDKKEDSSAAPRKSKNTAVFVTCLPIDAQADEVAARFGRFGLIMEDDEGKPKVKLYQTEDGRFSGEALVVYYKEESVELAVTLLDDAELRLGEPGTRMKVQRAEYGHKAAEGDAAVENIGQKRSVDKKKATKRIGNMERKLADWNSDDEFGPAGPKINTSRVVVLKYMFTRQELSEDATLLLDLKEDVREECSMLGEVTNVVLYDEEDDGVMTVKFRDPVSAQACILKMNGRYFAGRKITAEFYDGRQKYSKSGHDALDGNADGEDNEQAERKRLDDFAEWLMKEGE
ncbi:Splicing factor U2AF-associated protein 2 [Ceratobasidium theobromae]|uniref:Splicing factor U2AF-associated protein 2 n=1 Tax=Ceratobasidium theobromae TaxID=1582974 RepID=A0A5N5QLP6_9AGAM|nr:Splicing factor U2AF-associated protein 2 [Ceratobasidium theobromae]